MNQNSLPSSLSPLSSNAPTRWLITGGCGFIGRNLIAVLLAEKKHFIRVIDNLSVGSKEDLRQVCAFSETAPEDVVAPSDARQGVELIVGDILDAGLALRVCEGFDVIVHLAANTGVGPSVENPRMDCETNVMGTLNYLEAARQSNVKRFIFASSGAPVGECDPPIHEELAPHPVSPYGASKLAGEGYCSAYYRTFGVETVVLRFGNVYGPLSSHKSSVVAKFIRQALTGEVCEIYGDGRQTRDFIYIDDLVDAILKAATCKVAGEIFQIATNRESTVNEITAVLTRELAKHGIAMQVEYGDSRIGEVRRNYSDTGKALRMLAWESLVPPDEGIRRTVEWFLRGREE